MHEVLQQLAATESRLQSKIKAMLKLAQQNLETVLASAVFRNPLLLVHNKEQQLDDLQMGLTDVIKAVLASARQKIHAGYEQIVKLEPHRLLGKKTVDLNDLKNRTNAAIQAVVKNRWMQLVAQENRLAGLNPKSVLQRGYSITTNKRTRLLVRNLKDIQIGDLMITELADKNLIESKVTKK
jgi:exodeoxyribonuclease VII large subunit